MARAPARRTRIRLEGLDHVMRHVVERCKGDSLTAPGVNQAIRNLMYTITCEKRCAEIVKNVLDRLIEEGLAEERADGTARKGTRGRQCRWKPWDAIRADPASEGIRARLGLVASDFQ